ncbi:Transthyretin-like family protein [Ancylostoma caninum]|uniref:Transthyretin-like family protein n=1 Tax=Ancylostoma caninum TaxID=29170 RepID=A0A368GBF5_ANCCA|nr:Transthyretin-like family protein [Ancylostoma caninum]
MRAIILLIFLPFSRAIPKYDSLRTVKAMGTLMCKGKPLEGQLVEVYDKEANEGNSRSLVASTKTNWRGGFTLKFETLKVSNVEPSFKLVFKHRCNYQGYCRKKNRMVSLPIPPQHIGHGKNPVQFHDFGTLNLETNLPGKTFDCPMWDTTNSNSPRRA